MDSFGNLFGTTYYGGTNNNGTIFEIEKNGYTSTPVTLADFGAVDGIPNPQGPLILDAAGDLFGTTFYGGSAAGGTVFELVKTTTGYANAPTILINFDGSSVWGPTASIVSDAAGDLFGTFEVGGSGGGGGVFEVVKTTTGYAATPKILAGFSSAAGPPSPLYIDSSGDLFGITLNSGYNVSGSVFEIARTATGYANSPTTIANFSGGYGGGLLPPGLIADAVGDLFFMNGLGNQVFEVVKTSSGYSSTLVIVATIPENDGYGHSSPLSIDRAGDLFGTSSDGGPGGYGTIFEIPKTASGYGAPILLQSFNGTNGAYPQQSGVIPDGAGDLFGTTSGGSLAVAGSVYEIPLTSTGYAATLSTLAILGASPSVNGVISSPPMSGLIIDQAGSLFGTTYSGGATGGGSVYEIAQAGTSFPSSLISLASVPGFVADSVAADAAGNLFGVSSGSGALFNGSVFEIARSTTGYETTPEVLTNFSDGAVTGYHATGGLVIDPDGNLFGAATYGGVGGGGTIFEIAKTPSGHASAPIALANFSGTGNSPYGYLTLDPAGNLFGTAGGGAHNMGTIFEIVKTASGYANSPTTILDFTDFTPTVGPLAMDAAGDLFGTGAIYALPTDQVLKSTGIVYEIKKTSTGYAASPTILTTFNGDSNGSLPIRGVIIDAAGDLFGITGDGGTSNLGTVYEIAKSANGYAGGSKILLNFGGTYGFDPNGGLVADAFGDLYGTTQNGGANGGGTIFEITGSGYQAPTISVHTALTAPQNGPVNIADSSANVISNLANLQTLASNSLISIAFTDPTAPVFSLNGAQLAADATALAAISSPYSLTVTGSTNVAAAAAIRFADLVGNIAVADSAAHVGAALDSLQSDLATGKLGRIALTDSGIPTLSLNAGQLVSDAAAINDISGNFSLSVTAPSSSATIVGAANALGNTVVVANDSTQYRITPAGDGNHFTITGDGFTDTLSDIQALQFSNLTLTVAQTPGTTAVTTGNIAELYGAIFGRPPDVAGLAYYQRALITNPSLSLLTLAQDFLASPEYADNSAHNYAESSAGDAQFVTDSYQNLLHRVPEAGAVPYYQNLISQFTHGLTPGTSAYAEAQLLGHASVITDFSQSTEFLSDVQVTAKNPASSQQWLLLI